MKRVVVGLSGGVDSSVAAHLLVQEGYEVIGMYMQNWHDETVTLSNDCPWIDDSNDALMIAQQLGIPFQVIDLSKEYKERIVDYMFNEYASGRTPNPDVLCNREIKFDVFMKAAEDLGADFVATGHYCRKKENSDGTFGLLSGLDKNKDQSYFLCQISQDQLSRALFPIGELTKEEVRKIASEIGLVTAEKKDSQGLCFVGKISLPQFLQQSLTAKTGDVIEIPDDLTIFKDYERLIQSSKSLDELSCPFEYKPEFGKKVAEHQGAHFYTIGQRKGLHIGGRPNPSFVIATDTINNIVYSGQTEGHPGLNRICLKLENKNINWINLKYKFHFDSQIDCHVRIRYRQALQKGKLILENEEYYILFDVKQKGITPGQFAAWYIDDELIGSGVILS